MKPRLSHTPRKRFGQNFLQDNRVIENIVSAIHPNPDDRIVEIGPGLGAITKLLLEQIEHLTVIEIDRDLACQLETNFAHHNKLSVVREDILKFDLHALNQGQMKPKKFRIVGNLPYNISTPLIFHLLKFSNLIQDMHFMLQKEVVDRLEATPNHKDYGRLSIMSQYFCRTDRLFGVGPEAFYPRPKVQSAFVRFVPYETLPHPVTNHKLLQDITRTAFNQRRKTLSNALKPYLQETDFIQLKLDPRLRPEVLSLADFARIANFIDAEKKPIKDE